MRQRSLTIVGGGVVGLSLAYELLRRGWRINIIDLESSITQASWAGAGILTPANPDRASHPLDQLAGLSNDVHERWSSDLFRETGIDNEYRRCGGYYLARSPGDEASLMGAMTDWQDEGIEVHRCTPSELRKRLGPGFDPSERLRTALWLPDERQLRNPRHLRALRAAITSRGGILSRVDQPPLVRRHGDQIRVGLANGDQVEADCVCLCAGAWSQQIMMACGIHLPTTPVRGQMLLYKHQRPLLDSILNEGNRYVVPRRDGYTLVGSTVEEVGFDGSTTDEALDSLKRFADGWHADLSPDHVVASWAGLRPASFDGMPYLGRLPGTINGFVATAFFRSGLQLSAGAAVLMADLIEEKPARIDSQLFNVQRVAGSNAAVSPPA